jgi:hypothetical protein
MFVVILPFEFLQSVVLQRLFFTVRCYSRGGQRRFTHGVRGVYKDTPVADGLSILSKIMPKVDENKVVSSSFAEKLGMNIGRPPDFCKANQQMAKQWRRRSTPHARHAIQLPVLL